MEESKTSKISFKKRAWRVFYRIIVAIIVLILLLLFLINLPATQKYLTTKTSNYLEEKLKTEVNISYIGWRLPKQVMAQEIYIETPKGDTLFYLKDMEVEVSLWSLLRRKIEITGVDITNIKGSILMQKDSSNIDFILDAFSSGKKATKSIKKSNSSPWEITFSKTTLGLNQADVLFNSDALGIELDLDIGSFQGSVDTANVLNNNYLINDITLKNSKITYNSFTSPKTDSIPSKLDLLLGINKAKLENVEYEMTMDDLLLKTKVDGMTADNFLLHLLGKSVEFSIAAATVEEGTFDLDRLNKPSIEDFDNNHLRFREISGKVEDLTYHDIDIETKIISLKGKTGKNINIKSANGLLAFSKEGVYLNDFSAKTNGSELKNSKVILEYDFLKDKPNYEDIVLDVDTKNATVTLSEINYFSPVLEPYFKDYNEVFTFDTKLKGALTDLQINHLDIKGLDAHLLANGSVQNTMRPTQLEMNLNIPFFEGQASTLERFVSDTLLPKGTNLPQLFKFDGAISGAIQNTLNLNINASLSHNENSFPTKITTTGFLKNIMEDSLEYNFHIDTFLTNRQEIFAYLPDNSLPEGYNLPEKLEAAGHISGTLNKIDTDLIIKAISNNKESYLKSLGSVSNFSNPDFNLRLSDIQLDNNLVYELLPESFLTTNIHIPNIKKGRIKLLGTLKNLKADAQLNTDAGSINSIVHLLKEDYTISLAWQKVNLLKITNGNLRDTLEKADIGLVNLALNAKGKNFNDFQNANGNASFTIQGDTSQYSGMRVDAILKDKKLNASISYEDKIGAAEADVFYDLKNNYRFNTVLHDLDLKQIPYLRQDIVLSGKIDLEIRYDSLTDMTAKMAMQDINFLYNEEDYLLEIMEANAIFKGENKKINIASDWVDANINGALDFDKFATETKKLLNRYLKKEIEKETAQNINTTIVSADVDWKNTRFLTSGIIPGLQKIEPFQIDIDFISAKNKLIGALNFPKITYNGTEFTDITGTIKTSRNTLDYFLNVKDLKLPTVTDMGRLEINGAIEKGVLQAHLINVDTSLITNLDLKLNVEKKEEDLYFNFKQDLILNHSPWKFDINNEIIYSNNSIFVQDLKLYNEQETLEVKSISKDEILINFDNFKLEEILSLVQMQEYSGGTINGTVSLHKPMTDLRIDANLDLKDALFYQNALGNAKIEIDNLDKASIYNLDFKLAGEGNDAKIKGTYDLENNVDAFDMIANIESLQLSPFERLLDTYISNLEGKLTGKSEISGTALAPSLVGFIQAENAGFTIDELKAPLRLGSQKIDLDGNAIYFNNFEVYDSTNNKALLNAYILTEDYKDFFYDLDVSAENFMVLNTSAKDNSLYYGTLIVDADAKVKGDLFSPIIDVDASPRKGSKLAYVLPTDSGQIDKGDGVVTFTNGFEEIEKEKISITDTLKSQLARTLNLRVNTNLEINKNLNFTAFLDPITGDAFTARGDGFLSFSMFPSGDMEMSGTISLTEGHYNLVYEGLVKRKFDIVSGSTLKWTGNIYNPELDLNVRYEVKTAPYPLVASQGAVTEEDANRLKQKEIFYTELNITGDLEKTGIKTSISYPEIAGNSNNSEISAAIASLKQNENRMNEQAFGLILFNSFLSENFNIGTNVLTSQFSINDAISNQLNSLANRYIKFVDVSFGLESYNKYDESGFSNKQTDFSLTLGKRFFNDKLAVSVDGKSTNSNNGSQVYLDNLIVEYSITENGFWKIKVYNRRENDAISSTEIIKSGAALVLHKDFNEFRFFKKKKEKL